MKDEKETSAGIANNSEVKKDEDKKLPGVMPDTAPATDNVKSRPGHGLANEGTNVDYEEQR